MKSETFDKIVSFLKSSWLWLVIFGAAIAIFTFFGPLEERTLGDRARIVYLHGAWVWVALVFIGLAGIVGLFALVIWDPSIHKWSRALGRTGLLFWITFLPMSLYVMQVNWNGLFLDEPRFRVPLQFAGVGLLLQVGLSLIPPPHFASIANIAYAIAIFFSMSNTESVLHPEGPILNSPFKIQFFFVVLFVLLLVAGIQVARMFRSLEPEDILVR